MNSACIKLSPGQKPVDQEIYGRLRTMGFANGLQLFARSRPGQCLVCAVLQAANQPQRSGRSFIRHAE